jgi:hypothetical protein
MVTFLHDLFLPIFLHAHISVHYIILTLFPCICYSVVEHTLCNVTLCIVTLPTLGVLILCGLFSRLIFEVFCIRSLFLFAIILLHDFFCSALYCVAIISLSVSPFKSLLDSHRDVSSSLISCLKVPLIQWSWITLFFYFFFKDSPHLAFVGLMLSFLCQCLHLIRLILIQYLLLFICWIYICLILFVVFNNIYKLEFLYSYFVFRCSAILIRSALYDCFSLLQASSPTPPFPFYI